MKKGYLSKPLSYFPLMGILFVGGVEAGRYPHLGTADEPGTLVTTQGVLQTAANQITNLIENRLRQIKDPAAPVNGAGFSAGDPLTGFGMWGNVEYDHLDNSLSSTQYDGHIVYASVGLDTFFGEWGTAALGLAVNWEEENLDTLFNAGKQTVNAWALMPYAAFMLTDEWSLAFLLGYERLGYDLRRTDPLLLNSLVGEPSGERYFGAGELVFQRYCDDWDFGAQMAIVYLQEITGGYNEVSSQYSVFHSKADYHLGRFKLGGTVGYVFADCLEPYVRAAFLWDFTQTDVVASPVQAAPANSDVAGLFAIGLNFFSTDNVLFNADLYREAFRDDFTHWGAMVNFRVTL